MKNQFTTFYLTKMPSSEEITAIENLTEIDISYGAFSSPAINVYSVKIIKLLEVKALLASMGIFIEKQSMSKSLEE